MSSLWTPSGEHRVERQSPGGAPPSPPSGGPAGPPVGPGGGGPGDQERAEAQGAVDELRRQLAEAPAEMVVANHIYGIFELAAIYLSQDPPLLRGAALAIDAMAALVDGLAGRLGDNEASLKEALAQIRLAFVQVQAAQQAGGQAGGSGNGAAE